MLLSFHESHSVVLQDFVGHFENVGKLEVVEAAVMRMEAATMDFNQVTMFNLL